LAGLTTLQVEGIQSKDLVVTSLHIIEKEISEMLIKWNQTSATIDFNSDSDAKKHS